MPDVTASVGCILLITLLIAAYFPLHAKMMDESFQAWSWGPALTNLLPVFLAGFGVFFCMVLIKVGTMGGNRPVK